MLYNTPVEKFLHFLILVLQHFSKETLKVKNSRGKLTVKILGRKTVEAAMLPLGAFTKAGSVQDSSAPHWGP